MYVITTAVFVAVGQHSPPEKQDDFATVFVLALAVRSRQ
jgi:hypothetical protein